MRLALCGPGRCGKDTMAERLGKTTRLRYWGSTSEVIAPLAADRLGVSVEVAFARRHQDRELWRRLGDELRVNDRAALARAVLERGDLVVGIRSRGEIEGVRAERLADLVVWIDRPGIPFDPTIEFGPEMADVVIQNWWGVAEFNARVDAFAKALGVAR